jgi:phosphate-selective porin OprO/OprP
MRKCNSNIAKKFASGIAVLGVAFSGSAFTAENTKQKNNVPSKNEVRQPHREKSRDTEKAWDLGRGWKLTSMGGLSYEHPNDARYWFKLSGVIRLDETLFMGSYRDKAPINGVGFPNGAEIRRAELYLDGGVGEDWEYTMSLNFHRLSASRPHLGDTWIAYSGFCENNQVFVGRVPGNWFGLDNANSTTWMAFLERSLPTIAFYPGDGLGIMTDFWWDSGAITLTALQPDKMQSNTPFGVNDTVLALATREVRDRWTGIVRATYAPAHELGNVWHFGVSGAWKENITSFNGVPVAMVAFGALPSSRSRNTAALVDTGRIIANNTRWVNVEMARQCGPFMLEGEFTEVFVHRIRSEYGTLRFHGWNVQARYMLTGEVHEYDVRDGQFGSIDPMSDCGAFEVAARYDYVNLNSKNIRGGSEHNVTVGLNWFVNKSVRLSANYIRASAHPTMIHSERDGLRRHLDILGLRCQIRFK